MTLLIPPPDPKELSTGVALIHQRGIAKAAKLEDGKVIKREDRIFIEIESINRLVPTAPYDNHFVYVNPKVDESAYMCTCGSPAVVIRTNASSGVYGASLMDPNAKLMVVCLLHASYGKHSNAS